MKQKKFLKRSVLPAGLVVSLTAAAQLTTPIVLERPVEEPLNRFGASFRMAFNVDVDFKNVGTFSSIAGSRLTPDGDPFNFDDGYVLRDNSIDPTFTRYWGYDTADQLPGDGTVVMHRSSSAGNSTGGSKDEMQPGLELTYARQLGRRGNMRWGVEAALGYMNVNVRDSHPLSIGVNRLSTPFQLPTLEGGGFVVPPLPHRGRYDLPSNGDPVLYSTPLESSSAIVQAAMTGSRDFEADIFTLRLGPYVEWPLAEKWTLGFSGGLALAQVNSDFSFTEAVQLPGVPTASGSGSHNDLLVGGYVAANVTYKLNEDWALVGGVQFQHVGEYTHRENGREAVLDLGSTVFVSVGASFSF